MVDQPLTTQPKENITNISSVNNEFLKPHNEEIDSTTENTNQISGLNQNQSQNQNENQNQIIQEEVISEIETNPSKLPQDNNDDDDNNNDQKTTPELNSNVIEESPIIVDKTDEQTKDNIKIQNTPDALTSLADLEEEEFIDNVNSAHGTK